MERNKGGAARSHADLQRSERERDSALTPRGCQSLFGRERAAKDLGARVEAEDAEGDRGGHDDRGEEREDDLLEARHRRRHATTTGDRQPPRDPLVPLSLLSGQIERFASPEFYTPTHLVEKILTSRGVLEGERKPTSRSTSPIRAMICSSAMAVVRGPLLFLCR